MKKIFYLAVAVLGIASTASCNKAQFEEKELKGSAEKLTVVGSIAGESGTKVTFTDTGSAIHPEWEVGDQVFGFSDAGNVTYSVESVSAEGKANFTLVDGTEPGEGVTAYMIYAPGKSVSDLSSNQLAVDLSAQDGTLAGIKDHAIMCATATVADSKLKLTFTNQVAILGVEQFTGLKENTTYTSATFTTAGPTATIKVVGGQLQLVADNTFGTITATGTFASDASGNTTCPIYFAVPPTPAVSHTFCLHSTEDHRAGVLSPKAAAAGDFLSMPSKAMSQTIYFEDFEGTVTGWSGGGSASSTYKKNGSKSFQVSGGITDIHRPCTNSSDILVLETYFYQDTDPGSVYAGSIGWGYFATQLIQIDGKVYASGNSANYELPISTFHDNQWHHMRMEINKSSKLFQMYIDGILMSGTRSSETTSNFEIRTGADRFFDEIYLSSGYGTIYFDDILLFSQPDYIPAASLVQHWPFDGNMNNAVTGGVNASPTGTSPTLTYDRFGNANSAYYFNGSGGMIADGAFNFGTGSFTENLWICSTQTAASGHNILRTDDGYSASGCMLRLNGGKLEIWEGRSASYDMVTANTYADGKWHMLSYVRNVDTREGLLYVDGVYVGKYVISGTINNVSRPLSFGNVSGIEFYQGAMDDVRLYNYALSSSQIAKLYNQSSLPEGVLPGSFSVSATKKVRFSKGNLQATCSSASPLTYSWGFAANQYSYVGNAAGNTTINSQTLGKVVDLFGWSTSESYYGIKTGILGFGGDFIEYGKALGASSQWRTLSKDEWTYLLSDAPSGRGAGDRFFKKGVTVCGKTGCLIIAPDGNSTDIASEYDAAQWAVAESAGFVCLPRAGHRNDSSTVYDCENYGKYWSSTTDSDPDQAYYLSVNAINHNPASINMRYYGYSVRLVVDAN